MITNIELSGMYYLIHRDNGVLSVVRAALPSASCDPLSPPEELVGEMYEYQERMKARANVLTKLLQDVRALVVDEYGAGPTSERIDAVLAAHSATGVTACSRE